MPNKKFNKEDAYDRLESIIMGKVFSLEAENVSLQNELSIAKAKLEIYERLASISNEKVQLGFGPPIIKD